MPRTMTAWRTICEARGVLHVTQLLRAAVRGEEHLVPRAPRLARKHGAIDVVWAVCRHCNQRCPHCVEAATLVPSAAQLTTAEGLQVVRELAREGAGHLVFSGGEPLLRDDLVALVTHASSLGLTTQLSTNGLLLDAATAERLRAAGLRGVSVSIDGLTPHHDRWRGTRGSFARAIAALQNARAAGLETYLRVTLTRHNEAEIMPLVALADSEGIDGLHVAHLVYAGRTRGLEAEDLTPAQSRALLELLIDRADEMRVAGRPLDIATDGNESGGPLLVLWLEQHYGPVVAARARRMLARWRANDAAEGTLSIDHAGRVHPGELWQKPVLADLREEPLSAALAHPMRAQLAERERYLEGRCGACRFSTLCRGSNRGRALAATGSTWGSDPACVLTDEEIAPQEASVVDARCDAAGA